MDHESKEKAVKGVAWTSAANWGCQLLGFCFYSTFARLLDPQTFGLVALSWVYIALIQIFVTQGFGMAIIQRRDLEDEHLNSAFWIAVTTALLFCISSILLAGPIAHFFREPRITSVIRWLCLTMFFNALCSVQTAILTRELDFRPLAIRSLAATTVGGTVGVAMAFLGCGVWSLVGQQLVAAVLGCIFVWFSVSWRPRLKVSKRHLRDLYRFSLSITGNDILWFFSQKSDQTIVGYGFGAIGLGPYSLASKVTSLACDGLLVPFQGVAFPAFSKLQSEPLEFESALHKFCEISSFLCLPIFAGLAVAAPEIVALLFGPKWIAAVPILQALAFYGALRVVLTFMHPLMLAKGRAGLYLLMGVVLSILTLAGCLIAVRWNPIAIAVSMAASISTFFAMFLCVSERFLEVKAVPLLRSFAFPVMFSLVMSLAIGLIKGFEPKGTSPLASLTVAVATGVAAYWGIASLLRPDLLKGLCRIAGKSLLPSSRSKTEVLLAVEDELEGIMVEAAAVEKEVCRKLSIPSETFD